MVFFILALLMILVSTAKVASPNTFKENYIDKNNANVIKGIFVVLIIFSHGSQYIKLGGVYDEPYLQLKEHLNQMVVSMFFFYSGFGMMKSILKKKFEYVKGIPLKRFLIVLLNFDIAVMLFVILYLFYGKTFSLSVILYSLIGWESVGNSNWYMFAIFALYILMYIAFYILRWFGQKYMCYVCAAVFTLLTALFVLWEIRVGQPTWWYNTMILFPFGCWYALLQKPIEKVMMKNDYIYSGICALLLFGYVMTFMKRWSYGIEGYTVWAVAFTLLVVFFTMKVTFDSKVLSWFGEHIFSVYILQRIPMIVFSKAGIAATHKYMFLILCIVFTVAIALVFDYLTGKLNKFILKKVH